MRVRRAGLTLFVLFLVYMCNGIDRNVLGVLFEPIKKEFSLSDARLGLLATGFGLCYAISGLFFGVLADRTSRRNLIAACVAFWSAATAACGLVASFPQLLWARAAVGVGEAGASPAAMSMISDLYPSGRRATAMSVYYLSTPIGFMIALAAGGLIARDLGWRWAFLLAAVPGAVLVPVLLLAVSEPVRGGVAQAAAVRAPYFREFLRFVAGQRSLLLLILGSTLNVLVLAGVGAWTVSYLVRAHGVSIAVAGAYVGGLQGIVGIAGTLCGGILADRLGRRDVRARLWLVSVALVLGMLCTFGWVRAERFWLGASFYGLTAFLHSIWYGPIYSLGQELVRVRMRSTVAGVIYLITNLAGGFGPALIGALSDRFSAAGRGGLGSALIVVAALNVASAVTFATAARTLAGDLGRAQS